MNFRLYTWLFLIAGLTMLKGSSVAWAQDQPGAKGKPKPVVTTIYLVRHAEKDTTANPADPDLSAAGQARAQVLSQLLARRRPSALFTTDTKRTRATLAPLAAATKLEPLVYNARQNTALAVTLRKEYIGKTVVVVGHSNTLLPLIESLGGTPPVEEIGENEYDYLFTMRITDGALPTVDVRGYGTERKLKTSVKAARGR